MPEDFTVRNEEALLDYDVAEEFIEADFSEKKEIVKRVTGHDTVSPVAWNVVVQPDRFEVEVTYVWVVSSAGSTTTSDDGW